MLNGCWWIGGLVKLHIKNCFSGAYELLNWAVQNIVFLFVDSLFKELVINYLNILIL